MSRWQKQERDQTVAIRLFKKSRFGHFIRI